MGKGPPVQGWGAMGTRSEEQQGVTAWGREHRYQPGEWGAEVLLQTHGIQTTACSLKEARVFQFSFSSLQQEQANHGPGVKSGPLLVFVQPLSEERILHFKMVGNKTQKKPISRPVTI